MATMKPIPFLKTPQEIAELNMLLHTFNARKCDTFS